MLLAYNHLRLPSGHLTGPAVVDIDDLTGQILSWHPLQCEEPFVVWRGGTLDLNPSLISQP